MFERGEGGAVELRLSRDERSLLAGVVAELRALLDGAPGDPSLRRLFPPAYDEAEDYGCGFHYRRAELFDYDHADEDAEAETYELGVGEGEWAGCGDAWAEGVVALAVVAVGRAGPVLHTVADEVDAD